MDHLRCIGGDRRIRNGVFTTGPAWAIDPVRGVAHGIEHDDVLRLSRLSDRSVSNLDPRPRIRPGLFDEPDQRDVFRLYRRLYAARSRRPRRVWPDHGRD